MTNTTKLVSDLKTRSQPLKNQWIDDIVNHAEHYSTIHQQRPTPQTYRMFLVYYDGARKMIATEEQYNQMVQGLRR